MSEMIPRERVRNLLERKPVDRAAFCESFCEAEARWRKRTFKDGEPANLHFKMDIEQADG